MSGRRLSKWKSRPSRIRGAGSSRPSCRKDLSARGASGRGPRLKRRLAGLLERISGQRSPIDPRLHLGALARIGGNAAVLVDRPRAAQSAPRSGSARGTRPDRMPVVEQDRNRAAGIHPKQPRSEGLGTRPSRSGRRGGPHSRSGALGEAEPGLHRAERRTRCDRAPTPLHEGTRGRPGSRPGRDGSGVGVFR